VSAVYPIRLASSRVIEGFINEMLAKLTKKILKSSQTLVNSRASHGKIYPDLLGSALLAVASL